MENIISILKEVQSMNIGDIEILRGEIIRIQVAKEYDIKEEIRKLLN